MERECEHLLSYLANELDSKEQKKFMEHVKHCPECQIEYSQMKEAWDSLQFNFEEQEVPDSLKAEVFSFIDENSQKNASETEDSKFKKWTVMLLKQFTPLTASFVIVLLVISLGVGVVNVQLRNELANEVQYPIEILSTMELTSADPQTQNANGYAVVCQQGSTKALVIQVNNMPKLDGSKVYQVWLLKNGERQNAGIFKTDESGSGGVTYLISEQQSFDDIGITLEPDQNSTQPRGKKIVGT